MNTIELGEKGKRRGGSANWAGYCGHFGVVGLAGV